jgi:Ca2+-binding RTX toxin-like protein
MYQQRMEDRMVWPVGIESLENRWLLSAGLTVSLARGTLTVLGSPGNDRIIIQRNGNNLVIAGLAQAYPLAKVKRLLVDGLAGRDRVELVAGKSPLSLPAELRGGAGHDTILGGNGPNTILGGAGNDQLTGGPLADDIDGGDGADLLRGLAGPDILRGGAGDDSIHGGEGDDLLQGMGGDDLLVGEAGRDTLLGGPGLDTLDGQDGTGGDQLLAGGPGEVWYYDTDAGGSPLDEGDFPTTDG